MRAIPILTPLDIAWRRIDALGGVPADEVERGFNAGLTAALAVIESLGGRDPLQVRAEAIIQAERRIA